MAESVVKIEGVYPAIDGEYPLSINQFTNRDLSDIKRIAKVRVKELQEAFEQGDTDLIVAFAVIALRHAGKTVIEDLLWDAPMGKITLVTTDEEEVDDLPPALAPPSEAPSVPAGGAEPNGQSNSSGANSSNGSGHQENDPSPTGAPDSGIGATSPLETWAT
jgi:hypothetical protein